MRLSDRVYAARKYGYTGRDNVTHEVYELDGIRVEYWKLGEYVDVFENDRRTRTFEGVKPGKVIAILETIAEPRLAVREKGVRV